MHTRTMAGLEYELIAFEPEWTLNHCHPEDLKCIETIFKTHSHSSQQESVLFNGGLVGYLSYDFSRQQTHNKPSRPVSIAMADFPPAVHIGYYPTNYLIVDHQHKTITGDIAEASLPEADQPASAKPPGQFRLTSEFEANWTLEQYSNAYDRIKQYILAGDCYQVNLTQMLSSSYQGDPFAAFSKVLEKHKTPHSAYLSTGKGDVLCFSPESFLSIENGYICTKPIKGTRQRAADPDQDRKTAAKLMASTKDRAENIMIVDLLRNDLGRIAKTGSVRVRQLCELESFSNVHHLVSTIQAKLQDHISPLAALLTCSPGGSITGAPKIRAMEIIDELEDFPRNVYCGSVFFYSHHGRLESNIAIRTLACHNGQAFIWGGGGIVADSDKNEEHQESLVKIKHIMDVLTETS